MKKLLFIIAFASAVTLNAQVTIFEDSFENYDDFSSAGFGDWINLDLNSISHPTGQVSRFIQQEFTIMNPSATFTSVLPADISREFESKKGRKYAACFGAVNVSGSEKEPNKSWLISPAIDLGISANQVSFFVKSAYAICGLENYEVGIYVGSGVPTAASDFTLISGENPLSAPENWEKKTFKLDAYANQTVRIGIRCITAKNSFLFGVDDFKVTTAKKGTQCFFGKNLIVYPNPAKDVLNFKFKNGLKINKVHVIDSNGRPNTKIPQSSALKAQINVSDLTKGVYYLLIDTNKGRASTSFFKS